MCLGLALGGCATGSGEGFGASFGASPQGGGDGADDNDSEGETESGDDDDDDDDDGSGSATSGDDDDDNGSTDAGDVCDPACAADEECIGGTCFPSGGGSTGAMECHDTGGAWEACLDADDDVDTSMCGGDSPTCLTGGDPAIVGSCSWECTDECDCPATPASGTAPSTCSDITGSGTSLCSLDCSAGTCPTGMTCFAELACVWEGAGAAGEPYGDCFNNGSSICGLEGLCLQDGDEMMMIDPTISVCSLPCTVNADCDPAPPGGSAPVLCTDVTTDGANECIIDCGAGQSCPTGMTCFGSLLCAWD